MIHVQLLLLAVVATLSAIYTWSTYRPRRQYVRDREADDDYWSHLHADKDLATVQQALAAITSAFLLNEDDAARLRAEDRLIDVYRAAYPFRDTPDSLEFETLWTDIRDSLGASESELRGLTDMTVQDVVAMWLAKSESRRETTR
jgi:hypothetical protein